MYYREIEQEGYEKVVHVKDSFTGLDCYIAIHSTKLGTALGGCRMYSYTSDEAALEDVLRLAKGMTYKNSLAGLDLGGGKAVINLANAKKTPELLKRFGEVLNSLEGQYITAEDVGSNLNDMSVIKQVSPHVASLAGAGDPSPATALGVYRGIEACVNFWRKDLEPKFLLKNVSVAIQGLGNVGYALAQMLHQQGACVIATDINPKVCDKAYKEMGIHCVVPDEIYDVQADVFAPCAMGGILTEDTVARLRTYMICGSANNQLQDDSIGDLLHHKRFIYAPDYLVNAGGVLNIYREFGTVNSDFHLSLMLDQIRNTTTKCLKISKVNNIPSYKVANDLAEERL